ncbi:Signal-transduction regulatory protein FlgR [hydrothermal vent metagenome]|uniref:Signal-transduction regulatory protein FlgR n=1 Tax=hydrothermal vent metagenome TaxID=652676 RepID=A0A3B1D1H0_9ZZZZ
MHEEKITAGTILLVDDEPDLLENCARILEEENYKCVTTTKSVEVMGLIKEHSPGVVVTDYKMPVKNGVEVLKDVSSRYPHIPVVMISAYTTIPGVVEAVKTGAFDYLTKPFSSDQLIITVGRALDQFRLRMENIALKTELQNDFFNHYFVGKHPRFLKIVDLIKKVAPTDSNILIFGETGTGKELVAKAIHIHSKRAQEPFIVADCATLTKETLESARVAGDEPGEPTHKSVFEAAEGGTLYLEKIEDLDLSMQARLLRILQDKTLPRSGEWEWVPVDVRVIASTTSDLHAAMSEKKFRETLYYCLNVVNIDIPPLRERREDIGILCDHFLRRKSESDGSPVKIVHHDPLARLMEYKWPGNVRELQSVIETAASLAEDNTLGVESLPRSLLQSNSASRLSFKEAKKKWIEGNEKQYLENLLLSNGGNISKASEEAGIARMSLYRMIRRNNLSKLAVHERSTIKNNPADK